MRSEQTAVKAQKQAKAVADLSIALEHHAIGTPFVLPASCYDFPDLRRLTQAIGFKQIPRAPQQPAIQPSPPQPGESHQ